VDQVDGELAGSPSYPASLGVTHLEELAFPLWPGGSL
jgi:hypothetical protein